MHVEPTRAAIERFLASDLQGHVTMLNLLRFRDVADYSRSPELAPAESISGEDAYHRYGEAVLPMLERVGAEVVTMATGGPVVIGPDDEHWDLLLLVRYPDVSAFLSMTTSSEYLAIAGHRTAALADSRLLPTRAA